MRTTVTIDDEVLIAAKRRAAAVGRTLGQYVETALRREMARTTADAGGAADVPVFTGGGGPQPGVDLASNRALREVLDEGRTLTELR